MFKRCSCPLQENSNFQVRYWTNSTEPTLFTAAESDQWNNLTHPPLAICLWPVAMAPSLTSLQRRNRSYPSGRSQDDPYHGNLVPSSPVSGWARSCRCDWRQSRSIIRNESLCLSKNHSQVLQPVRTSSHSLHFWIATQISVCFPTTPWQELERHHDKRRVFCLLHGVCREGSIWVSEIRRLHFMLAIILSRKRQKKARRE